RVALFEAYAWCKRSMTLAGIRNRTVEDIDPDKLRARVPGRETRRDLAAAAADIRDARLRRQRVAVEEFFLLWPDRVGLRGEIAQHRLVGHLLGLWIAVLLHACSALGGWWTKHSITL